MKKNGAGNGIEDEGNSEITTTNCEASVQNQI